MKKILKHRHLILAWIWMLLAIPAFIWWKDAIWFVIAMSLYANVESSISAYNSQRDKEKS